MLIPLKTVGMVKSTEVTVQGLVSYPTMRCLPSSVRLLSSTTKKLVV